MIPTSQYRPLGRTGLSVSPLSLGGGPLGDLYGKMDLAEAIAVVRGAIDLGINLVDVSPYYGLTKAESVLGHALAGSWRDKVILSTKAGRIDLAEFDFSPAHVVRSVEASLQRLGTDYLDILLAHDIEFAEDFEQIYSETFQCLQKLKLQGKCRFIGMSGYPLGILRQALDRCELDLVLSYCHNTLQNDQLMTDLLPAIESRGAGLINASPLGMGLLTREGPPPWHPASNQIKDACRQAAEHCRIRGRDLSRLALQFSVRELRIPTTLVGMKSARELDADLAAVATPVDEQLLAEVRDILAPVHNQTWPVGRWPHEDNA